MVCSPDPVRRRWECVYGALQVLSDRQELVTEFQGEKFFLRVRSIVVVGKGGEQASVPRGALVATTAFVFDASTTSGIKVRGPARCTTQGMRSPMIW